MTAREAPTPGGSPVKALRTHTGKPIETVAWHTVATAYPAQTGQWPRNLWVGELVSAVGSSPLAHQCQALFVVAGRLRSPTSSRARNHIPVVVCTRPREWGSTQRLAGRWASHSCASSKTWPHPPVRRQQCARSTPTQLVPQQDILVLIPTFSLFECLFE